MKGCYLRVHVCDMHSSSERSEVWLWLVRFLADIQNLDRGNIDETLHLTNAHQTQLIAARMNDRIDDVNVALMQPLI